MLTWISWMAWSGFCQMHLVWKQAGCAGIIGPGFWQDAKRPCAGFPLSDTVAFCHTTSWIILYKTSCVSFKFGPNGSGPKARWCARIIGPASGQHFRADLDWMRNGSGTFTGVDAMWCMNSRKLSRMCYDCMSVTSFW